MNEHIEPDQGETAGSSYVDYGELLRRAQQGDSEREVSSPERQRPDRESFSVTYLNTSFSGAFDHPEGLDNLLLHDEKPRENAIFGLSEVTKDQRGSVRAALEARGYQVVEPPEDSQLDLIWAVGPELEIESTDAHNFSRKGLRKVASRTGSDNYRHVGIQDLTVVTPQGNRVRLGQERLSPWIVEPVRRLQLGEVDEVLRNEFSRERDDANDVLLTINGGDMNHIGPFRRPDDRVWGKLKDEEGWEPVLEPGTATHYSGEKYARSGKVFKALGRRNDETQLDAVYARPRTGAALVKVEASSNADLAAHEIGYSSETIKVDGTDHYAVETTYLLPTQQRPDPNVV